jgi:predicted metal-dependent phosphoesterase TrpH
MKIDCHCHTIYSKHWFWGYDSINTPREMIKAAVKKGLDGLAVTDHNNVKGSLMAKKAAKSFKGFKIITGTEIRTNKGEVLGLGINKNVPMKLSMQETIDRIHDLGGIAVIPHPFGKYFFKLSIIKNPLNADAVEVYNSSVRKGGNKKAMNLARKFKKGMTAGSDAHSIRNVGNAGIICSGNPLEAIKKGKVKIFGKPTTVIDMSDLIIKKFLRSAEWRLSRKRGKHV